MRGAFTWLVGVAVVAAAIGAWQWRGGQPAREPAGEPAPEIAAGNPAELVVREPVRFENLTIFPVSSTVARDQDRLITLAEGLQSGLVVISEVGAQQAQQAEPAGDGARRNPDADEPTVDPANIAAAGQVDPFADNGQDEFNAGADVNHLLVTNNSSKPLYLMPGEILVGGQQDRCVGEELVVAAHTQRMEIEVFCVEHGRWSARSQDESMELAARLSDGQADAGAPAQSEANQPGGTFSQTAGYLGKQGRLTVQADQDQADVWNQVSAVISQTQATTESGDVHRELCRRRGGRPTRALRGGHGKSHCPDAARGRRDRGGQRPDSGRRHVRVDAAVSQVMAQAAQELLRSTRRSKASRARANSQCVTWPAPKPFCWAPCRPKAPPPATATGW